MSGLVIGRVLLSVSLGRLVVPRSINEGNPMTKTKNSIAAIAVLLGVFFVASFSSCQKGPKPSDSKQPFDIGMVTFAGYAPLYLAKEKGFFGETPLDLKRIEEIPSIRAALVRGDLDAYLATPDIALNITSQPPGKAVWAIDESAGGDGVAVAPGIKS